MSVYRGFASQANVVDRVPSPRPVTPSSPAAVSPTWAPPVAASRAVVSTPAVWSPPVVWPAPDLAVSLLLSMAPRRVTPAGWPPPTFSRSPWPPPVVPVAASSTALDRRRGPSPDLCVLRPGSRDSRRTVVDTAVVEHERPTVRRGRSLAYALAGLAAAVVGFAVIVIR